MTAPETPTTGGMTPEPARSNRATSTAKAQDSTPPDNLVDWWKWVTKPVPPARQQEGQPLPQPTAPGPAAPSKAQAVVQNSTAPGTRAAPATRPKPRAIAPAILLDAEAMFIPNEVLALNLDRDGRAHARTLQFKSVGSVDVPNVGVVIRLLVPNDMGTLLARLLLQNDLPADSFSSTTSTEPFTTRQTAAPALADQSGDRQLRAAALPIAATALRLSTGSRISPNAQRASRSASSILGSTKTTLPSTGADSRAGNFRRRAVRKRPIGTAPVSSPSSRAIPTAAPLGSFPMPNSSWRTPSSPTRAATS